MALHDAARRFAGGLFAWLGIAAAALAGTEAQFTQRFFDESRIMYRLSQGNLNIVRAITTGVTMSPETIAAA